MAKMTPEQRRVYNRNKQRQYRDAKRGKPPRKWISTERIFGEEGHCNSCGMRLDAEFHIKFPCDKKTYGDVEAWKAVSKEMEKLKPFKQINTHL